MKATVLFASPRGRASNTMALLRPALETWRGAGYEAAVVTCGYRPERGADLFLEGMRRWCRHTEMRWLGALSERHMGYGTGFMNGEKAAHAAEFARQVLIPLSDAAEAAAPAER